MAIDGEALEVLFVDDIHEASPDEVETDRCTRVIISVIAAGMRLPSFLNIAYRISTIRLIRVFNWLTSTCNDS